MTEVIDPKKVHKTRISVVATVWVCPTPGCGNYYGAKSTEAHDLAIAMNSPAVDNVAEHERKTGSRFTHSRAECPDCRAKGTKVDRVPVTTRIMVDAVGPAADANAA